MAKISCCLPINYVETLQVQHQHQHQTSSILRGVEQWKTTLLFTVVLLFSLFTSVVSIEAAESSFIARLFGPCSGAHSSPR